MNVVNIGGLVGAFFVLKFLQESLFPLIMIKGCSMNPTYKEGEVFLTHRIFNHSRLKQGDVVVFPNPNKESDHAMLVKRVANFTIRWNGEELVWLLGDNSGNSLDSRDFGWIPIKDLKFVAFKSRPKEV